MIIDQSGNSQHQALIIKRQTLIIKRQLKSFKFPLRFGQADKLIPIKATVKVYGKF